MVITLKSNGNIGILIRSTAAFDMEAFRFSRSLLPIFEWTQKNKFSHLKSTTTLAVFMYRKN